MELHMSAIPPNPPLTRQDAEADLMKILVPQATLENWHESSTYRPNPKFAVLGYNGSKIIRCKYDHNDKCWKDLDGKKANVYMWTKQ
jgi:hypothetical protein